MNDELYSPQWYRVAELFPQLREHLKVHKQIQRGKTWYLLEDEVTGRQHRIDPVAYQLIARFNGEHKIDDLWNTLLEELADDAPTQPHVVQLVGQLHQADLIQCNLTPDVEELFDRQERRSKQRRKAFVNPLAFRTPLNDPTKILDWLEPKTRWLFSNAMLLVFTLLVLISSTLGISHWQEISAHASLHLLAPHYWILLWILYPILKVIHEFAHALAVRHWGGQVHEMGITLLIMMPIPYVDASSANLFSSKYKRMLVSAAGIMVELSFAALALLIWLNTGDGVIRDIAFIIMTIGGVSTVLFNANPLVKYDGYYILADWLEIPNLAWQTKRFWSWLARRYLLQLKDIQAMTLQEGEAKWLAGYGIASYSYRIILMVIIAQWLSNISLILAALVAGSFLFSLLLKPSWEVFSYLKSSPEVEHFRLRIWFKTGLAVTLLFGTLAFVPLPYSTLSQGVVWSVEETKIRANVDGFISAVLVEDGAQVNRGQVVILLENSALDAEEKLAKLKLRSLRTQLQEALSQRSTEVGKLNSNIQFADAELRSIEEEKAGLTLSSHDFGRFVIDNPEDLIGQWVSKGTLIANLVTEHQPLIRTAIPQKDAGLIKEDTQSITVRLVDDPKNTLDGIVSNAVPSATYDLPSGALSTSTGGSITTNPQDNDSKTSIDPVFLVDVTVDSSQSLTRRGTRAWVRFEHRSKPLISQWAFRSKQLFLQHFTTQEISG